MKIIKLYKSCEFDSFELQKAINYIGHEPIKKVINEQYIISYKLSKNNNIIIQTPTKRNIIKISSGEWFHEFNKMLEYVELTPKQWPIIKGLELWELINQHDFYLDLFYNAFEHMDFSEIITNEDYEIEQTLTTLYIAMENVELDYMLKNKYLHLIEEVKEVLHGL